MDDGRVEGVRGALDGLHLGGVEACCEVLADGREDVLGGRKVVLASSHWP